MKKIGIMGGTFNPIHNAHLMMAQAAYEQYGLDEVWFMPSKNPPHKDRDTIVSEDHRSRMVKAAIDGIPYFKFSGMELKRDGVTYTCDTVKAVHKDDPANELYFIMGGDSLENFDKWYHPEKILKYCTVLAVPRDTLSVEQTEALCRKQGKRFHGKILPVSMEHIGISSEQIRRRIQNKESALAFCPEAVVTYIELHGLYGYKTMKREQKGVDKTLLRCLASTLRPKRYLHTLGVAHIATSMAFCHCPDPDRDGRRAELAGLLHDCAKYYTGEEMLALCDEYGIELTDTERRNTALIHGKLGAYLAAERYGIGDEEICSAISFHTTGKPDMTTLEKILYIADYIEPGRRMDCHPYPLDEIRRESFRDLDCALRMVLANTVEYLRSDPAKEIDELTMETYDYYNKGGGQ